MNVYFRALGFGFRGFEGVWKVSKLRFRRIERWLAEMQGARCAVDDDGCVLGSSRPP